MRAWNASATSLWLCTALAPDVAQRMLEISGKARSVTDRRGEKLLPQRPAQLISATKVARQGDIFREPFVGIFRDQPPQSCRAADARGDAPGSGPAAQRDDRRAHRQHITCRRPAVERER